MSALFAVCAQQVIRRFLRSGSAHLGKKTSEMRGIPGHSLLHCGGPSHLFTNDAGTISKQKSKSLPPNSLREETTCASDIMIL